MHDVTVTGMRQINVESRSGRRIMRKGTQCFLCRPPSLLQEIKRRTSIFVLIAIGTAVATTRRKTTTTSGNVRRCHHTQLFIMSKRDKSEIVPTFLVRDLK